MPSSCVHYLPFVAILGLILFTLGRFRTDHLLDSAVLGVNKSHGSQGDQALVVASRIADNMTWIEDERLANWTKYVYVVDNTKAALRVPNKSGRESMVYLTYIIDNYDNLPEVSTFIHSGRFQWHNDDPDYDNLRLLSLLRTQHVKEQGYVNLRCSWILGCPVNLRPTADEGQSGDRTAHIAYKKNFHSIFPGEELPDVISQPCCAQFAVTASTIRARPKEFYTRARDWLSGLDMDDGTSGRLLEFSWHMVFGKEPVHCPSEKQCYCKVYGLCDVECKADGTCPGYYVLAKFSILPKGWPHVGWDGQSRNLQWDTGLPD